MDEAQIAHLQGHIRRLDALRSEGARLRTAFDFSVATPETLARLRLWQADCGGVVNELSGGSKAHWLARAFSQAFLVPVAGDAPGHSPAAEASPGQIVRRLIEVLEQARRALAELEHDGSGAVSPAAQPSAPRFEFVADATVRPRLEAAFRDGQAAFERGDYLRALVSAASVLETIITDALEQGAHRGRDPGVPIDSIWQWSFDERIAAAERARLISAGCARLPALARTYRDLLDARGEPREPAGAVTERDARLVRQVLQVIMRDLAPGR